MRNMMILGAIGLLTACGTGSKDMTQRQQIGHHWKYEDGAGGVKVAYIGSANTVQTMTAPDTFAVMLIQPMSNGEKDVTVKLVGAPFRCDLSDCAITATTDDGKTHRWHGRMADTHDGIEIAPSQKAYQAIVKSGTVNVNLAVGPKDQTFPFEFKVEGLDLKG